MTSNKRLLPRQLFKTILEKRVALMVFKKKLHSVQNSYSAVTASSLDQLV